MAGDRQTAEVADARVAAAKARLTALADEARPGRYLLGHASSLVRARPWQGMGVALIAGLALGVAPRRAVHRLALLATPVVGMVADLAPVARFGVRAGRARRRPAPGRSR